MARRVRQKRHYAAHMQASAGTLQIRHLRSVPHLDALSLHRGQDLVKTNRQLPEGWRQPHTFARQSHFVAPW